MASPPWFPTAPADRPRLNPRLCLVVCILICWVLASIVQPPKKEQKTKEQKAAAAQGASKGKGKKKKWSKGKGHDRKNNLVTYDVAGFEKLLKEIPKSKVHFVFASIICHDLAARCS